MKRSTKHSKKRTATRRAKRPAIRGPYQKLLASVDVFEQDIVISRFDGNSVERRMATPGDVAALFAATSAGRVAWWPSSPNVLAVGLDADGDQRWLVHRKAGPATIVILFGSKRRRCTVAMPALLSELSGTYQGRKTVWKAVRRVYAVGGAAGAAITASTPLYACPTPNVHAKGRASMCSVRMDRVSGTPLEAFEMAFFGSAFTEAGLGECLSDAGRKLFRSSWHMLSSCGRAKRPIDLGWLRREGTCGDLFDLGKGAK